MQSHPHAVQKNSVDHKIRSYLKNVYFGFEMLQTKKLEIMTNE